MATFRDLKGRPVLAAEDEPDPRDVHPVIVRSSAVPAPPAEFASTEDPEPNGAGPAVLSVTERLTVIEARVSRLESTMGKPFKRRSSESEP